MNEERTWRIVEIETQRWIIEKRDTINVNLNLIVAIKKAYRGEVIVVGKWCKWCFYWLECQPIGYEEIYREKKNGTERNLIDLWKKKDSMSEQTISEIVFNDEEIELLENDYDRWVEFYQI